MAQENTIAEFLAVLGFKIDESGWSRFERGMTSATLKAKLLGDAIETMAKTVAEKIAQTADQFEQLFYQTQRIGAAAESIRAFAYAVSQLGGTVSGANASLQAFGDFMRSTPGAERLIQGLGVATRDAQGRAIDRGQLLLDIGQRLGQMARTGPTGVAQAQAWANIFHIDPETLLAIERPGIEGRYRQSLASARSAGIGGDLTAQATKFEQTWRELWQRLGNISDAGQVKLSDGLTAPLKKFNEWLDKHQPELNSAIDKVTKSLDGLATTWAEDLGKIALGDDQTKGINSAADAIAHFVDTLKPLIHELDEFNKASKSWWFIRFFDSMASGNLVTPLPDGPGFFASHGPGVSAGGIWGGIKRWWGRHAPGWLGGGSSSAGTPVAPPGPPGTYRPQYALTDKDLSDRVLGVVAGEARMNDPGGVDAVIDTMFNRLGTKAYGPSGNLEEVATAPGQFAGYRAPTAAEAEYIRRRIRAIASGGVADNTRGATEFRTSTYAPFVERHPEGRDIGGNFFATVAPPGPYAAYPAPHVAAKPASTSFPHPAALDWSNPAAPGWAAINAALPVGAAGAMSVGGDKTVNSSVVNNINVNAPDPHSAAAMVGVHLDRSAADVQRNLQGAFQ